MKVLSLVSVEGSATLASTIAACLSGLLPTSLLCMCGSLLTLPSMDDESMEALFFSVLISVD